MFIWFFITYDMVICRDGSINHPPYISNQNVWLFWFRCFMTCRLFLYVLLFREDELTIRPYNCFCHFFIHLVHSQSLSYVHDFLYLQRHFMNFDLLFLSFPPSFLSSSSWLLIPIYSPGIYFLPLVTRPMLQGVLFLYILLRGANDYVHLSFFQCQ